MTPAAQQSLDHRLHMQLQFTALAYAKQVKRLWPHMDAAQRKSAMAYMRVYEGFLTNWGKK